MSVREILSIDVARAALVKIQGVDCYSSTIMFPEGESDQDSIRWLSEVLAKIAKKGGENSDKAERALAFVKRLMIHGYMDHAAMHAGNAIARQNTELMDNLNAIVETMPKA